MSREHVVGSDVRHAIQRRILSQQPIHSQSELVERMREAGCEVAQATVSRDLAALGVYKVHDRDGRSVYVLPDAGMAISEARRREIKDFEQQLSQLRREFVVDSFRFGNMVTLRCPSGAANYVAAALDDLACHEVKGTIAGDDTILMILASDAAAREMERFIA